VSLPSMLTSDEHTASAQTGSTSDSLAFPFLDLGLQYAALRNEIAAAVLNVMEHHQFILGPDVKVFETSIAALLQTKFCLGCASGSDALLLALLSLGVGPGDEVITTPFTFVATAGAVCQTGATPVFVDVQPDTFNIDPKLVSLAITDRTRAIIPVHLFGLPADLDPILAAARARGIAVIEDAAQAIGAQYKAKPVASLGTIGCLSFFPSKNLGGAGDGGLVATQDPALAERIRLLRVHGSRKKYHSEILGVNSRLDSIQAAILQVKLSHLNDWNQRRRDAAARYRALFDQEGLSRVVTLPSERPDCVHVYNQFVIRCRERDDLRTFMRARGIPTEVYYPVPLHLQPAFEYLHYAAGQLPVSETLSQEVLALPIFPELGADRQQAVVNAIAAFYRN
jgi:dTDP-4-amino-4,6-dideoxygalactose transaminase